MQCLMLLLIWTFVHHLSLKYKNNNSHSKRSNKMQQCIKIYYSVFMWSSTCFGWHRPSSGA